MCKFCERNSDGDRFAMLAGEKKTPEKKEAFGLFLNEEIGAKNSNGELVYTSYFKDRATIIKAAVWDEKGLRALYVPISFCPFCGEQLYS